MVLNGKRMPLKFDENFKKNCDEDSNKGRIFEVDVDLKQMVIYNSYHKSEN